MFTGTTPQLRDGWNTGAVRVLIPESAMAIVLVFVSFLCLTGVKADMFERRLYEDLLKSYDPLARPVKNSSEPVLVSLGISLQQILDVDEKNQIIQTNIWLTYVRNGLRKIRSPEELHF